MVYLKRLISYAKLHKVFYILAFVLSVITMIAHTMMPFLSKHIVDEGLMKMDKAALMYWAIFLGGAGVIRAVSLYIRDCALHIASQKVIRNIRGDLYDKLQEQSFSFYDNVRIGLLMNRLVGDLDSIRNFLVQVLLQVVESFVALALTFALMFSMDTTLGFAILIIAPFLYFNTRKLAKEVRPMYQQVRKAFEHLTSVTQENITGIRVVKAFGREEYEKQKFFSVAKEFTDTNITAAQTHAKYTPFAALINGVGLVFILLLGGYLVMIGQTTIGTIVAFTGYVTQLNTPMSQISNIINQWQNVLASMEKICELLDSNPTVTNKPDAVSAKNSIGDICFENVSFQYKESEVLKNFNLTIKKGSTVALMGATGSGKTTVINLLARFYDTAKGSVLISGTNVKDMNMDSLRKNIGIIMQEPFLFSDTIAANIAFGRPQANMEEIKKAAKTACAHEFIKNLPNGYETVVGERGVGLSGGQKQRIAIARAILYNPQILVMDDSTSSVDMETEFSIQKRMEAVMKNRTTIIVAHRVSSVKGADQIIFMQDGMILEQGTHSELMALKGTYYETFLEQYKEYNKAEAGVKEEMI